jgi:hypothetical protein
VPVEEVVHDPSCESPDDVVVQAQPPPLQIFLSAQVQVQEHSQHVR